MSGRQMYKRIRIEGEVRYYEGGPIVREKETLRKVDLCFLDGLTERVEVRITYILKP